MKWRAAKAGRANRSQFECWRDRPAHALSASPCPGDQSKSLSGLCAGGSDRRKVRCCRKRSEVEAGKMKRLLPLLLLACCQQPADPKAEHLARQNDGTLVFPPGRYRRRLRAGYSHGYAPTLLYRGNAGELRCGGRRQLASARSRIVLARLSLANAETAASARPQTLFCLRQGDRSA